MGGDHVMAENIKSLDVKPLIGRQFGTSTVVKELGRGNMAIVFIAFQQTLKRRIALKLLPEEFISPEAAARFQQEAEAAAILAHPNIIPIYEVGEVDGYLFMCMQLVEGNDLHQLITRVQKHPVPSKRILPLKATLNTVTQILDALAYAHDNHVVHRDIKPANILIEKHTRRPLISDFGMVRFTRGDQIGEGKIQGTPLYMAPEQITGGEVGGKADMYAVGVMLMQMVTPALPVKDYSSLFAMLKDKKDATQGIFLKTASQLNPELRQHMDQIIAKATAYDPAQRFASCREFARILNWYRTKYGL
jgi:serine/threonine protein kinase